MSNPLNTTASGETFTLILDNSALSVSLSAPNPAPLKIPVSWASSDPDLRDFDVFGCPASATASMAQLRQTQVGVHIRLE